MVERWLIPADSPSARKCGNASVSPAAYVSIVARGSGGCVNPVKQATSVTVP